MCLCFRLCFETMFHPLFSRWKLTVSAGFAVTYVILFNVFAIYNLARTPIHWLGGKGQLYAGGFISKLSCKRIKLSAKPLPMTALASFPGSGSTWLRHLVQQATGIATGSVYDDGGLRRNGFPAEGFVNSSVLLIKTHEWGENERKKFDRAVLLIRNPFDALKAEFNRRVAGHRGHATERHFRNTTAWDRYVSNMSRAWVAMNYDWLRFDQPLHVIFFENLKHNVTQEVKHLLHFLNTEVSSEDISCMEANSEGTFRRQRLNNSVFRFSADMNDDINKYKDILKEELRKKTKGQIKL